MTERGGRSGALQASSARAHLYDDAVRQMIDGHLCGVDEAGRGALAGPVVAAAVILPPHWCDGLIYDSKSLSARRRETAFEQISQVATAVGVGVVDHQYIDRYNILQATFEAMRLALAATTVAALTLVDGVTLPGFSGVQRRLVGGDRVSRSVAAASIVAKVVRDRLLVAAAGRHPGYGFERHVGYGTAQHLDALERLGPSPIHRLSFAPVALRCAAGTPIVGVNDPRRGRGQRGEQVAGRWLEAQGYVVVERNVRMRLGEIDIVAMDGDEIVFVEVRTRAQSAGVDVEQQAAASVDAVKQRRLRRLAQAYLQSRSELRMRFDVITVVEGAHDRIEVLHYPGAF